MNEGRGTRGRPTYKEREGRKGRWPTFKGNGTEEGKERRDGKGGVGIPPQVSRIDTVHTPPCL